MRGSVNGLAIVLQIVCCLFTIKGLSALIVPTPQKACHNTTAILNCSDFSQSKGGKLFWKVLVDKATKKWVQIATIRHGNAILSSGNTPLDGRVTVHPNGSLEITSLKPVDETQYQCLVKQGPRKLHVIELSVACGKVTKIEREVCVEEDIVLECEAKYRTNPLKVNQVKWHKQVNSVDTTWLLLAASNDSTTKVGQGFTLHGNGSLLLQGGRDESEDTYKCDVTKKGQEKLDRHIIVIKNVKCRKEKLQLATIRTTAGRVAMTTAYPIKGTEVVMETSTTASAKEILPRTTSTDVVTTSRANMRTTKGRADITTASANQESTVGMETSTSAPPKQTTANTESVEHMTSSTTGSSQSVSKTVTKAGDVPSTKSTMVCGGFLRDPVGTFQSPNFPNAYPANSYCKWTISVPQGYAAIDITLDHLHLENEDNCRSDYISILDELDNQVGCRHCGVYNSPVKTQVRGKVAVVVFRSDNSVQKTGFKLSYKSVLP